jgi:hypothetical protein
MADTNAQADIRGIDIDKVAKGYADEEIILKRFCSVSNTSAREIRWYQKTSGFLDSSDTTTMTASLIANTDFKSRPVTVEQSWTRNTSYVRKYFVESPWISDEDIKDSDVDILLTNIRDLVRAVEHQIDLRIYNVLTVSDVGTGENTVVITNEWDDYTNATPVADLMNAKLDIRQYGYNPEGAIFLINGTTHLHLVNWLIATKGSFVPTLSSELAKNGVVMEFLGLKVVVSEVVTADYAVVFVPQRAISWKTFTPVTSGTIDDLGIGKKIRVWEEGEAILTDPKAVTLLSNIGPT